VPIPTSSPNETFEISQWALGTWDCIIIIIIIFIPMEGRTPELSLIFGIPSQFFTRSSLIGGTQEEATAM